MATPQEVKKIGQVIEDATLQADLSSAEGLAEVGGSAVKFDASRIQTNEADISTLQTTVATSGLLSMFAGSLAPTGWLFCDGSSYATATYPDLFAVIGYTYGGAGSNFNVPDMREAAPVGIGTRASGSIAPDTYTLGQYKDDQMQGHHHEVYGNVSLPYFGSAGIAAGGNNGWDRRASDTDLIHARDIITDGANGTPRIGTTTRGKRLGVNFIIKT